MRKFGNPLQKMWIIWTKLEIIPNACYFLFRTGLSNIFCISCLHIFHKTKNSWNYQNNPLQTFGNPWFLILWVLPGWTTTTFYFCFVIVYESIVCSEQLNWALFFRKMQILLFSSIFCEFEPFPAVTVWFCDPSFHAEDNLRDSSTTFNKGSNIHWCSRRKHDALRAGGWKLLNRMKMSTFFLFCWNIIVFYLVLPFETTEDTCMFPGRQIKYNLSWSSNKALNASCKRDRRLFYVHW